MHQVVLQVVQQALDIVEFYCADVRNFAEMSSKILQNGV